MPVDVSGVSVVFGDVVALRRVSFIAGDGQTVALMGPSGSGKSTLLGVIGGETQPTEGRVSFGLTARPSLEWIFQSSPMLDRRSALDNAALGAIARGYDVEVAFDSAARVLIDLGLGDRLGTAMFRLSGGERQRVAVARAIVSRSEVVLADEPTASLDARSRQLVMDALAAAATGGATVIIATHDAFVAGQCDRIIALDPESLGAR